MQFIDYMQYDDICHIGNAYRDGYMEEKKTTSRLIYGVCVAAITKSEEDVKKMARIF